MTLKVYPPVRRTAEAETMQISEHSAREWFSKSHRWYVDKHQGCPWCRGCNRLYQSKRGTVHEFHCGTCDFFVCHDTVTGRYYAGEGTIRDTPLTQFAFGALEP